MNEENRENSELIPADSGIDKVVDAGAFVMAILPIPWLAPAVSAVLSGISNKRRIKRIHEALGQLNAELQDFKSESSDTYVQSDEFEELLERTLRQTADERSEEKRELYGRFLAAAIRSPGEPYDEQIRFLRDLELLQVDHIRILKAMLEEPDPNSNMYTGTTFSTLSERLPDISEPRLRDLVTQLSDMRTILGIDKTMVTPSTALNLRNRFTPYGKRFVRYLSD